jgi:hypothetical protein
MALRSSRFHSLSLLAAGEQWCWKLSCTTCGHMVFRWGLKALARGLDPDDADWPVHWGPEQASTRLAEVNGPMPPAGGWPVRQQVAIQEAARGTSLWSIAHDCPFPDWLGHLGILLHYTEDAERRNLVLTKGLAPQLVHFVQPRSA